MAIKRGEKYACSYCNKEYSDPVKADSCRDEHDLLYIPLSRTDLNRLLNFIYAKDDALLTESLMRNLRRFLRGS